MRLREPTHHKRRDEWGAKRGNFGRMEDVH